MEEKQFAEIIGRLKRKKKLDLLAILFSKNSVLYPD